MREDSRMRAVKPKKGKPPFVRAALQTRRQHIKELLCEQPLSFGGLREQVGGTVRDLDSELRHVQLSLHRPERFVVVEAARCAECDFEFRDRELKRFYAPGRCPSCRSTRIFDPVFRIDGVVEKSSAYAENEIGPTESNVGESENGDGE